MTGPDHYRAGEKHLTDAEEQIADGFHDAGAVTVQIALAHFAAAQVVATVDVDGVEFDDTEWTRATS